MQVEIKYAKKMWPEFFFYPNCLALYVKYYQILFSRGVDMKIADSYIFPPHVFCLGKIDTKETL